MYESFIYSVNAVVPIFILVILGYCIRRTGFLSDAFITGADRVVFHVALPALLFTDIVSAVEESGVGPDPAFTFFCTGGILAVFLAALAIVPLAVKGNPQRGSMIQASFRSNFAILGVPLVQNMFGDPGVRKIALVMPFCIALFNALAVIAFSVFAPEGKKLPPAKIAGNIVVSIAKNPLVIAIIAAVLASLLPF
jgi:predicted permease